ncbi:MAG TPA: VOC family protein [Ktedonobacterales bacterium]|jgi:catechol 2,3-dioxygenase
MSTTTLDPATTLGPVHLRVRDLDRSIRFYTNILGFTLAAREGDTAALTTGGADTWLRLTALPDAQSRPPRATGLYHIAILTPSRQALARSLRRLAEQDYSLTGVADHLVSEALYLDDPDGNGLEIYRDRPREDWPRLNGQIQMASDPLDLRALLAEGLDDERPWTGLDPATRVGHMHLRVSNLDDAARFYQDTLGFDLITRFGGSAAFLSVGGYHHHIGLNTWESRGGSPPPPNAVGLRAFDIVLPGEAGLAQVGERLRAAGAEGEARDGAIETRDPSGNGVRLRVAATA